MPSGLDSRFRVLRELGRGAVARVFEVYDALSDRNRALKVATVSGQQRRLRNEYRRISELRHPSIVRVYDFGFTDEGLPYYTMELVRGVPFGQLPMRRDPRVLAAVAGQVLDALAAIHARGWVHRDVKPGNVLTLGEGGAVLVRLIDLGLLVPIGTASRPSGTLAYMAPEVVRSEAVDGRADLYSLGVVLYEALLPASQASNLDDVVARLRERPPLPSEIDPTAPSGLSAFIAKLLEPSLADRFESAIAASDALARVAGGLAGDVSRRTRHERLMRGGATSHRNKLVRRVRRAVVDALRDGHGLAAVIEAGPGVGKTPLMRELSVQFNLDGLRVVHIPVTQAPDSPVAGLARLVGALDPRHPLLAKGDGASQPSDGSTSSGRDHAERVGRAAAQVLRLRPTVLFIDDVHLAEAVGLDAVRALCDEVDALPVVVIAASEMRHDGATSAGAIAPQGLHVSLPPLTAHEVAALCSHRLNGLELPELVAQRVAMDTRGMPSLVERTVARLLTDGVIVRRRARYWFVGGRYRSAQYGDADQVTTRLDQVAPENRPILWAAAVVGRGLRSRLVAHVADCRVERAADALAALSRDGILHPGEAHEEASFRFASRRLLASCYHSIPPDERRRLHDRAANSPEGAMGAGGRSEERVEHLLKGSDSQRAVQAAVEAGDRALRVGATGRAIEYYARGFARLPEGEDPRATTISLALGRLFERVGEPDRAATWYGTCVTTAPDDSAEAIAARLGLAGLALLRGDLAAATEYSTAARLRLAAREDSELYFEAKRLEARLAGQRGEAEHAEAVLVEALQRAEAEGRAAWSLSVLLDMAFVATRRGLYVRAVRYAREALRRAKVRGDVQAVAKGNAVLARGLIRAGRYGAARRALYAAERATRQAGDRLEQAALLRQWGNLRLREGDASGAVERYERSLELVRVCGARAEESVCLHHIGAVHVLMGHYHAGLTALLASRQLAHDSGDRLSEAATSLDLAVTYVDLGQFDRASEHIRAAENLTARLDNPVAAAKLPAVQAMIEQRQGRPTLTRQLLDGLAHLIEPLEDPGDRVFLLWHAGQLALVAGVSGEARDIAARMSQEVERGNLQHLRPHALALGGFVADQQGLRATALSLVGEAAMRARDLRLRPLEVELRTWLGVRQAGSDEGAEQLTTAMECSRELAAGVPPEALDNYLGSPMVQRLRGAFLLEAERVGSMKHQRDPNRVGKQQVDEL